MSKLYHIMKIAVLIVLIFIAYNILNYQKEIQKINISNAYQNDASKGIFNANEWKCKLIGIIENKIKETNFKKISQVITKEIIEYYHKSTKDIRKQEILTYNQNSSFFKNIANISLNSFNKLKVKGIEFAIEKGSGFLSNKLAEQQDKLQKIISKKTSKFIIKSLKTENDSKSFDYDCRPKNIIMKSTQNLKKQQNRLFFIWWILFFTVIIVFSLLYHKKHEFRKTLLIDSSLIALLLLFLGIVLPMMEINATLLDFKFTLLNQYVNFSNQSLYFRAKSIYDIVVILIHNNPFIAITILIFSIVFPTIKLIATLLLIFSQKPANYLKWIISNLGKWSMADVFITAIFLANLSFQTILSEQLKPLRENKTTEMAINTSNSTIQIGFYFFLGYVMLSMIIAKLTIKYIKEK